MNKDFLPVGSTVYNGGSKKMRSATDSSTLTRMIRETATFHPYAEGGPNGLYLPKRGRWNSYADAVPWMNGVRYGNLFLGAYESQPKSTVKDAYTSDIPEPPKVTLATPVYPVYLLGPVTSSNPSTLLIAASGTVWTYTIASNSVKSIAGSGTNLPNATNVDGQGMNARFADMVFLQGTQDGTLYVSSRTWNILRRISATGYVERFLGTGTLADYVPGTPFASATLYYPTQTYLDQSTGTLYVGNSRQVVLVNLATNALSSVQIGGTGYSFAFGQFGVDSNKNIIAAETSRHIIFKVTPSGTITIIAGGDGTSGYSDSSTPLNARFNAPSAVIVDAQDNIIVYDSGNLRFRKITPAGVVTTLAGDGTSGLTDGTGSGASFNIPLSHALQLQVDPSGSVWIPYGRVRKLTPAGVVTTVYTYN